MKILPAIDMLDGCCVRLTQGDYARKTTYDADPAQVAQRFVEAGAEGIHIVDLSGARQGTTVHHAQICALVANISVPIQVGGGIRSVDDAARYLEQGIARVLIGTALLEAPTMVRELAATWGSEPIAVSIDHRDGLVLTRGWMQTTEMTVIDCMEHVKAANIQWVVLTDVARDGTMGCVSPDQLQVIRAYIAHGFRVIAAGGVTTLDDIARLRDAGAAATIIGKALYEHRIDLARAIAVGRGATP